MSVSRSVPFYLAGILSIAAATSGVAVLAAARHRAEDQQAQARRAEVAAGPYTQVTAVTVAKNEQRLELQGEARPFAQVTLYGKVSGYLRSLSVDKGDHVTAGQLIATLESPELDRQYDGARADADYKRENARRTATLARGGFVAPKDADLDSSLAAVSEANVAALTSQRAYTQLRAPFTGTVTARFADPGALVQSAVNAQTSALPVVTIADIERLRVYAYVDQRAAALVRTGDAAEISLPGDSIGNAIAGQVTRLSHELDPKTRMMLVEIDLDNKARRIVPGSFVRVGLTIKAPPAVEVPIEALIVRDKKPFVATIPHLGEPRIKLKPIVLGGSGGMSGDGGALRISQGVTAGELVALNLGATSGDGAVIRPIVRPSAGK